MNNRETNNKERLTTTGSKGGVAFTFDLDITCAPLEAKKILRLAERLKEYEDLEEQGLLLRLPCKVGDVLYVIYNKQVVRAKCTGYTIQKDTLNKIDDSYVWIDSQESKRDYWKIYFKDFEKQCFLTQSEAEGKLRELEGK